MARLINWPNGLRANFREPLSGPRTVNAGVTTSVGNFVQTTGSPFGLWRWRFSFPPIRGQLFRRYRGWVTALHGGANATRVPFCDWDGLTAQQAGTTLQNYKGGQPWGNDMPWSNGHNWSNTPPIVPVASTAARDDTVISLGPAYWGHALDYGDLFGFMPFSFGLHMVTEVIEPGQYRVWPPLRKAITTDDYATLRPVLAMRLESEDAANAPRGAAFADGLSVTLVEVPDYTARQWFAD